MRSFARAARSSLAVVAIAVVLTGCGSGAAPAMTPPGSAAPPGPTVTLGAHDVAFETADLRVDANQPFTLVFVNREAVPHNVSIYVGDAGQARVFEGAVFNGPATRWYAVPALAPGEYIFRCEIHTNMTGRLVAG